MTNVMDGVPPPAPALVGPDPRPLLRRAKELMAAGRFGAVRPLLAALDKIGAEPVPVADLRATVAMRESRMEDAEACLDAAMAEWPDQPALYRRRAELRGLLGRYGEAACDAADAVLLDSADPVARAQLGFNMLQLGHLGEACACLSDALARAPAAAPFRQALSEAQELSGHPDLAAATLNGGIALAPRERKLRRDLVLLHARHGAWQSAWEAAEAARRDGLADATMFGLMGQALIQLGRWTEAADAYAEALKLDPRAPVVRQIAALLVSQAEVPSDAC